MEIYIGYTKLLSFYFFITFLDWGYVVDGVWYQNTTTTPRSGSMTMKAQSPLPLLFVNLVVLMSKMIIVIQQRLWLQLKGLKLWIRDFASLLILELSRSVSMQPLNTIHDLFIHLNIFINIFIQLSKNDNIR